MNTPLKMHDLLYIEEHQTCNHYRADIGTGFMYQELNANDQINQDRTRYNHLLLCLRGTCVLSYNQYCNRNFKAGEMVLIPRGSSFWGHITTPLCLLDMIFEAPVSGCDRLVLQNYQPLCSQIHYDFQPIEIRHPLDDFCNLLIFCLKNGMSCAHLHEMKHRELFFYLRGFYRKEEIALLFYPIISHSFDFRMFIYENCRDVTSVKELIARAGMSRSTFLRRFKTEFGESAHHWMQKQICQRIVLELTDPRVTIKDIMNKFGFDTPSNFSRFCRNSFQCTPSELIRKYRQKTPTPISGLEIDT